MHICPATNTNEEDGDHETVDGNDRDANDKVRFQIGYNLRKLNDHNAGVKSRHENPDGRNRQDNPLVLQENPTRNKQYFSSRPKTGI
jgi:hypothetical protein